VFISKLFRSMTKKTAI